MSISDRIKKVRLHNNLKMKEFGVHIGTSESNVSKLESGKVSVSESFIKLICSEFDINEEWLRTGEGKMEITLNVHSELGRELGKIIRNRSDLSVHKQKILAEMMKLPDDQWPVLTKLIQAFTDVEMEKIKKDEV